MAKQYFDVSKLKLDETGRTVLGEKELSELGEAPQAGADFQDWWDSLSDWWDTNHGRCVNVISCGDETNQESCTNMWDCSYGSNESQCFNDGCDGATNSGACSDI